MVLMKNAAKARAPRALCWVASSGMTGGFSPGRVFGPVVGTSRGTVGWLGRGGAGLLIVTGGGVDSGVEPTGVDDGSDSGLEAGTLAERGRLGTGASDDDVQAVANTATSSVAYAANARIRPTGAFCPRRCHPATILTQPVDGCGQDLRRWPTIDSTTRGQRVTDTRAARTPSWTGCPEPS